MGEDEWTHREPGSVTGSVVPPPVVPPPIGPGESPPNRPPLPRRQPQASGHQRSADADQLISPIRRASGTPGPDLAVAGPPGTADAQPQGRKAAPGQRRLRLAAQPAESPPQLPDNVRYLFKPVITHGRPAAGQPDAEVEQHSTAESGDASRPSAGNAGAPAADEQRRQP